MLVSVVVFFFQAEDGIRDAQESRGLGDVYKRQIEFRQYHNDDKIIADSEHTGKAFVIEVLHALGENLELNDL